MWDYGIDHVCETENLIFNSSGYSNGRTALEIIIGKKIDVSEYLDLGLYDWVTYRNKSGIGLPEVGIWLALSHRVGQLM